MNNQSEISMFCVIPELEDVPKHYVASCKTFREAIALCMSQARVKETRSMWASCINVSEAYLSAVINGTGKYPKSLNPDQIHELQTAAGNRAITQWMDMRSRGLLNSQSKQAEIARLEAQLAEARRTA